MLEKYKKNILTVAILAAATASPVSAQMVLEETLVTAQKRTQSLQDVPVAVSAMTGDDVANFGWERAADVAAQVPNMQISTPLGDAQPLFSIRGVSMVDYQPSATGPIGVYIDESYIASSFLHGLSMFDLERLEVLRGPQGTLYGKNTTGGAINLISRTPGIGDVTSGYITLGAGNYDLIESNGAVEATLVEDVLAARLAYTYRENDGVWENKTGDDMGQTKNTSFRVTLNYQPTENLNAILKLSHGESDPRSAAPRAEGTNANGLNIAGSPATLNPKAHEGSVNFLGKTESEMDFANLKLTFEFGDYSLVSVSSWSEGDYLSATDSDGTSDDLLAFVWGAEVTAVSQDLRLVSSFDGPINFIVGAYFSDDDLDTHIVNPEFFGTELLGPGGNVDPGQQLPGRNVIGRDCPEADDQCFCPCLVAQCVMGSCA